MHFLLAHSKTNVTFTPKAILIKTKTNDMLLTKTPCDELENYEDYKRRILDTAKQSLVSSMLKVSNSSLKTKDKEEFKLNSEKLLLTLI